MKRLIKWTLGHLPRPVVQRLAGWLVPLYGLLLRGNVDPRDNALCPSCLSLERHRLLWLWLRRETDLFERLPRLLHVAPEVCLMRHLRRAYRNRPDRYVTADLESPLADLHFDIQQIPLAGDSFDAVICNHLMEHVADDRQALRELLRILKPGGLGVLLAPVDYARAETFEDDTITDPAERTRLFGQYDHRRVYGRDYAERLRSAGFEAREIDYAARFTAEERRRYAFAADRLYVVRKPL